LEIKQAANTVRLKYVVFLLGSIFIIGTEALKSMKRLVTG